MILLLFVSACAPDPKEIRTEVDQLEDRQARLSETVQTLENQRRDLAQSVSDLQAQERILRAKTEGRRVRYLLHCELKQTHFSLDLMKHAKDAMNALEFDGATDETTYESTRIGDTLLKEFRGGSFLTESSVGDWQIKVLSKRVEAG